MKDVKPLQEESLDPSDWEPLRALALQIVEDVIDYTRDVRDRPLWQDMPPEVRARFRSSAPQKGRPLADVYQDLVTNMLPYPMGNIHPRFWMWYMGAVISLAHWAISWPRSLARTSGAAIMPPPRSISRSSTG